MGQFLLAVLPVYLAAMGASYLLFPPAANGKRGYRTSLSVQSKAVWDHAQKLYGKKLLLAAAMMAPLMAIRFMLAPGALYTALFFVFELIILCFAAVSTAQTLLRDIHR